MGSSASPHLLPSRPPPVARPHRGRHRWAHRRHLPHPTGQDRPPAQAASSSRFRSRRASMFPKSKAISWTSFSLPVGESARTLRCSDAHDIVPPLLGSGAPGRRRRHRRRTRGKGRDERRRHFPQASPQVIHRKHRAAFARPSGGLARPCSLGRPTIERGRRPTRGKAEATLSPIAPREDDPSATIAYGTRPLRLCVPEAHRPIGTCLALSTSPARQVINHHPGARPTLGVETIGPRKYSSLVGRGTHSS